MGDGEPDFFGDLGAGGLLGAAVLVDMAGDRCDPGRRRRPLEDQEPARGGDQHPDAGVVADGLAAGMPGRPGHAAPFGPLGDDDEPARHGRGVGGGQGVGRVEDLHPLGVGEVALGTGEDGDGQPRLLLGHGAVLGGDLGVEDGQPGGGQVLGDRVQRQLRRRCPRRRRRGVSVVAGGDLADEGVQRRSGAGGCLVGVADAGEAAADVEDEPPAWAQDVADGGEHLRRYVGLPDRGVAHHGVGAVGRNVVGQIVRPGR